MDFDWGSVEPGPYRWARAHFQSLLARTLADGTPTGFSSQSRQSQADPRSLLDDSWTLTSEWRYHYTDLIATKGDAVACLSRDPYSESVEVFVSAPTGDEAERLAVQLISRAKLSEVAEENLKVRFWSASPMGGGMSYARDLDAPEWADHAGSYETGARGQLDEIMTWQGGPPAGRLMLLHGPAGTGKTSAIRMMGQAWKSWADVHYVIDPDEFFAHAAYMTEVMLGDSGANRWRLIVVEDADELIAGDAKARSKQSMARLLNMTDGLIGQGLRVVVCITTNEPMDSLHPAILRVGRCAANVEIGALGASEADEWRTARGLPETSTDATLAELWDEERSARIARAKSIAASIGALRSVS